MADDEWPVRQLPDGLPGPGKEGLEKHKRAWHDWEESCKVTEENHLKKTQLKGSKVDVRDFAEEAKAKAEAEAERAEKERELEKERAAKK
jgi:hypothetical protein